MARRLTADEWTAVRKVFETDPRLSFGDLAKKFGISKQSIHAHAKAQGWQRVISLQELHERAQLRADRLVDGKPDDQALAPSRLDGIDEATARRAAVLERHRTEWNMPRKLAYEAAQSRDIEKARLAKTIAESLRNIQEGERKAWGLDAGEGSGDRVIVIDRS